MKRSARIALVLLGLALLAAAAAVFWIKIHGELARGEQVFWLAELWPPAAVLSIGLVTCLDFLVPRPPSGDGAAPKAPGRPPKSGSAPKSRRFGQRRA